ncbi:hypothetical protein CY34DRAFT_812141 [Suillus luteus UH-Slu-Lm8-n1]|uniref:Uncharacterized protein n=1 Tax=Suillus luteus UH-Slu-Lm8-n1 TaxID=930992 RepID=A0A0D0AMM8_9AGAM|nr:hypothetical protein CY34DRAFT_812141 [Suillus luteus UH-Slu-Lm8-n1]
MCVSHPSRCTSRCLNHCSAIYHTPRVPQLVFPLLIPHALKRNIRLRWRQLVWMISTTTYAADDFD